MGKLVYGVGVNDADYVLQKFETLGYTDAGVRVRKLVWACPFYTTWKHMLERCYSIKYHSRHTYEGCSVISQWIYFMNFRGWMEKQGWEGKHLDKDLLTPGNKVYGPDTCVFVDHKVINFVLESMVNAGQYPIGVSFHKSSGKFQAQCRNVFTGKGEYLGIFADPEEAHQAWLSRKLEQAYLLAAQQIDERVAEALIERYKNYK